MDVIDHTKSYKNQEIQVCNLLEV